MTDRARNRATIPDTAHAPVADTALSAGAAAASLGISEGSIRRAIARGDLRAIKRAGVYRIATAELERYRLHTAVPDHDRDPPVSWPVRIQPSTRALPRPLTSLVGREDERADLQQRLLRDDIQLVTITGPGGVGKTRLAVEMGRTLSGSFPDGVWFVDFLPLSDAALVPRTIMRALGLREPSGRRVANRLKTFLAHRRVLLILDNFERLIPAAPFVEMMIGDCPRLTVLATSRSPLHVSGEHQFALSPLPCPDAGRSLSMDDAASSAAVRLYRDRAEAAVPEFALTPENLRPVADICRRLDGLPLAIELAAARAKYLAPAAMLAQLDHRLDLLINDLQGQPARLQSMRHAIAWSYDLLTPEEQRLFRHLSVFVDGFTLNAAHTIQGGNATPSTPGDQVATGIATNPQAGADLLNGVMSLVDMSLVVRADAEGNEPRFRILDTLREFGVEHLEAHGELEHVREQHAAWYLALAESLEAERTGLAPATGFDRLGPERENIRSALEWLRERRHVRQGLRFASALWPLWLERGEVVEGRGCLTALLALPDAAADHIVWARAMGVTGALAQAQGDHQEAVAMSQQALEVFEAAKDARGSAMALTTLGLDAMIQGDTDAATAFLEEALTRFRRVNDPRAGAWALRHLSSVAARLGDITRTVTLAEEGLAIARAEGTPLDVARLLLNLAHAAALQGDLERADTLGHEALDLFQAAGDRWGIADALERLGHAALERGELALAEEVLQASHTLFLDVGDPEGRVVVLVLLGWLHRAQDRDAEAEHHVDEGLALARQRENPARIASALLARGALALDRGDRIAAATAWRESLDLATRSRDRLAMAAAMEWSAHLAGIDQTRMGARVLGAAAAYRAVEHVPVPASIQVERTDLIARMRGALGDHAFGDAFASGQLFSLDAGRREAEGILEAVADSSSTARGDVPHVPHVPAPATASTLALTRREHDVLALLAEGKSNRAIADVLCVSERTVESHIRHIYDKLDISSRAAAAAWAVRHGLA